MNTTFLGRKTRFGGSYALLILVVFFFLIPSAFQSARLSLHDKENDVKDWLPSDFPETAELEWFADHFAGESFVLATWEGCNADDQRLRLLEQKLQHETSGHGPPATIPASLAAEYRRARELGTELALLDSGNDFYNWGGQREKWLTTADGQWYFILPDGSLHRWAGAMNGPAGVIRAVQRRQGTFDLEGQLVTAFRVPEDSGFAIGPAKTNPFYNDTSLICAPLFHSVSTGVSIAAELAREGGSLWPRDFTDPAYRSRVAERLAVERLTGTLFAPTVPGDFAWTAAAFADLMRDQGDRLPPDWPLVVDATLKKVIDEDFGGSIADLRRAPQENQAIAWYAVFDAVDAEPPPPLTCVMVTLTELAQDNLAFAVGRGVMGGPRGRLLQLAEESGIRAASPPSMAPPPFNVAEVESLPGKPALRLGGPPVDNIAIDEEGTITLVRLVGYSILAGVFLSFLCFRSVKITIIVFIVGGSAAMLSMAVVGWTGGRVDAILMSMPSLVYVLGISGAIHVINYYRDESRARGQRGAAGRALAHAVLPCTLASVTTAIGLASLYTSNLAPISNFGLYAAIGVIATLTILFSYLPAALEVFAPSVTEQDNRKTGATVTAAPTPPKETWLAEVWAGVGRVVVRHHWAVTVACSLGLITATAGLWYVKTSVQLLKLFDPKARIIHDYAWLEDHFGKLVPMELVVRVPAGMQAERGSAAPGTADLAESRMVQSQTGGLVDSVLGKPLASPDPLGVATATSPRPEALDVLERLEAIHRVRTVVRRALGPQGIDVVGQTMGADTFLADLPGSSGSNAVRRRTKNELLEGLGELRRSDYAAIERSGPFRGSELWRISLRVSALSDVDYGQFISTLRRSVEPLMRAYDTREAILRTLDLQTEKDFSKTRVFVVGQQQPDSLAEIDVVRPRGADNASFSDDELILGENIYLGTLGELLDTENNRRSAWLGREQIRVLRDQGKLNAYLAAADAVVVLEDDVLSDAELAVSDRVVDARPIRRCRVTPSLLPGRIPDCESPGELAVVYTGVVPVVYKAQRTLLTSLVQSIGLAFVLIAFVMVVLLNPGRRPARFLNPKNQALGLGAGAVSMIPNVFPVLVVFGLMGHGSHWMPGYFLVDIGTMMTASVAMGVAVDDTIHFLSWFRSYLDEGKTRVEAVIETYRRVGPAMTQTTLVGGLGLFVFALSTFTPTQRFGTLMLGMLAVALIGDLVFLPAILVGPLGRFFKPRDIGQRYDKAEAGVGDSAIIPAGRERPAEAATARSPQPSESPGAESLYDPGKGDRSGVNLHLKSQRTDGPHRTNPTR